MRHLWDWLVCPCLRGAPRHRHNRGGYRRHGWREWLCWGRLAHRARARGWTKRQEGAA